MTKLLQELSSFEHHYIFYYKFFVLFPIKHSIFVPSLGVAQLFYVKVQVCKRNDEGFGSTIG
jgi:hypothetical protein